MEGKELGKIRSFLGKTQAQLAQLLGVSSKAVQSYEQGWRTVPPMIERQMLLFLETKRLSGTNVQPCWEIKNCSDEWKAPCIVWKLKIRRFCWFMIGTYCQGQLQKIWGNKIKICRDCEVYKLVFSVDPTLSSDSTAYRI